MAEREPGAFAKSNDAALAGLFSVDADAHLRKLAACMFPTPDLLPVELVRAALERNASTVAVVIRRRRLSVEDDGAAIAAAQWHDLASAFDPGLDATAREKAITALQSASATGIGLLAVFVPGARSIRIESSSAAGASAMEIVSGKARNLEARSGMNGTCITIRRRPGNATAEKQLLRELCAAVPAAITLNGRPIERKFLLRRSLARQSVDLGPGRAPAMVAIPARGDACRIWLLDRHIPWQAYASASYHGLVFEAALESVSLPSAAEFRLLADAAHRLYLWLAGRYHAFPSRYQERIEELVFNREKTSSDLPLLSSFSPFRLWGSKQRLDLDEVRRKAEKHALYVLPANGDPEVRIGRHQEALLLSPLQRDFLLNHLHLPLVEITAEMGSQGRLARLFSRLLRRTAMLVSRLPRLPLRSLVDADLSDGERQLCRVLEKHWRELNRGARRPPLAVAVAAGRGMAPAVLCRGAQERVLYLRRRHPLVILAASRVTNDQANAELAFAALAPLELLTTGRL